MKRLMSYTVSILMLSAVLLSACASAGTASPTAPAETAAPTSAAGAATATTAGEAQPSPTAAEATATTAAQPVTIQVFYPIAVDAPIAKILQGYIDQFQSEHPNITVEPVFSGGYTDVTTAIQTTIQGGGEPPALAVMLSTDIYDLANAGYIEPLSDYLDAMPDKESYLNDFIPAFMANSKYDNKIWSIPFQRSDVVLYYNKDLFKENNLSAPDSWQSWAEAAQKLTQREGNNVTRWGLLYPSTFTYWLFQPLPIGAGQNIVKEGEPGEVFFDTPEVIDSIKFYDDLSQQYNAMPAGVQDNWGEAPTDFASGHAAMIMHTSGSLTSILDQADFEVGVMPVPGKEAGTYASVPGGGNLYILAGAPKEKRDAAWQFIQFLTQPEIAADFSINTGYIATRQSAYDTQAMKDYLQKVPQAADTRDALQYAQAELSTYDLGQVRTELNNQLQSAINGQQSPEQAMQQAQQQAESDLQAFK